LQKPQELLSDGERRKVDLASSLLDKADLWIWDEPLTNRDMNSRDQLAQLILEFEPTLLIVEHDESFLRRVCDRRICLKLKIKYISFISTHKYVILEGGSQGRPPKAFPVKHWKRKVKLKVMVAVKRLIHLFAFMLWINIRLLVLSVGVGAAFAYSPGWHNVPGTDQTVQEFLLEHPEVSQIFEFHAEVWSAVDRVNRAQVQTMNQLDTLSSQRAYWIQASPIQGLRVQGSSGDLNVEFQIGSFSEDSLDLEFEYSLDNGLTFQAVNSVLGAVQNLGSSGDNYHQINWQSALDFEGVQRNVRLRVRGRTASGKVFEAVSHQLVLNDPEAINSQPPRIVRRIPFLENFPVPASLQAVQIKFHQEIDPASIRPDSIVLSSPEQANIPGQIKLSGEVLSFQLSEKLSSGTSYTVVVHPGVSNLRGIPLGTSQSWSFRVEGPTEFGLFEEVNSVIWNNQAVRKVLQAFAFGGFASDAQIQSWAYMNPREAIEEILSFYPVNFLLSPPDEDNLQLAGFTLSDLAAHFHSEASGLEAQARDRFDLDSYDWNVPLNTWVMAATKRGINPFFHRVGLFESNYHMAVNQLSGPSLRQLQGYYDGIMTNHARRLPYEMVLAHAALSPTIAVQYGHQHNQFRNGQFYGNEDFAREIHQLFFGILGEGDPAFSSYPSFDRYDSYSQYHEQLTIPNTARALTDMAVNWEQYQIRYGVEEHHQLPLEILGSSVDGQNAQEKVLALVEHDINHPESLKNLPLLIIKHFGEDTPPSQVVSQIQTAWAAMESKDLLTFLRNYAISTAFHRAERVKYWTSFERILRNHNMTHFDNQDSYGHSMALPWLLSEENVEFFRPNHDVFGHQTGIEASQSGRVLREAVNTTTVRQWASTISESENSTYNDKEWIIDYAELGPKDTQGRYLVKEMAEWLWDRIIGDGGKNFGIVERSQVYALMNRGTDFAAIVDRDNLEAMYAEEQILNSDSVRQLYQDLENGVFLYLGSEDPEFARQSLEDNHRIAAAAAFISVTPYAFVQEGK